ncbi:MAG TPA: carbon storage regulator CsrA [Bacillota bacterium]|nr:carbon storage regulator CsrA [Bacillota bacterium]
MLVLTRKKGETIIIQNGIEITVLEIKGYQVKLGVNAPADVSIVRKEIIEAVKSENSAAVTKNNPDLSKISAMLGNKE